MKSLTYVDGTCVEMIKAKTIRRNNTSGVPGVDWRRSKGRWRASICFKGKRYYLGSHQVFEDAVRARKRAEKEMEQASIFRTAPSFDMAMFLALAVNVPSLVIFVVKVETAFYEKFVLYISALNKGTLYMIEKERNVMTRAILQELFFVYEVQLIITVILVCLVSVFFPFLDVSIHMLRMFVILSFGVCAVFCMYFTMVVFYYFSDYGGACVSSVVFLVVTVLCAAAAVLWDTFYLLPLPLLLGGLCGWVVSFLLLRRRMDTLDSFLMC